MGMNTTATLRNKKADGTYLTDSAGNDAGNVVAEEAALVGTPERYKLTFNASTELPANKAAVTPAEVITITPTAGKSRALITFTQDKGMVPFAIGAVAAVNANDTTVSAARLSIADKTEGATLTSADSVDSDIASEGSSIFIDMSRVAGTIEKISLVGLATGGTGVASNSFATVTVW